MKKNKIFIILEFFAGLGFLANACIDISDYEYVSAFVANIIGAFFWWHMIMLIFSNRISVRVMRKTQAEEPAYDPINFNF